MQQHYYKIAKQIMHISLAKGQCIEKVLPSFIPFAHTPAIDEQIHCRITVNNDFEFCAERKEIGFYSCANSNSGVFTTPNGDYQIEIFNVNNELCGKIQANASFSEINIALASAPHLQHFALNNCTMLAFAYSGCADNVLLIHASVVVKDGYAYLFLGKSGTGKSTHSKLWIHNVEGCRLLNDDNPAIRVENNEVRAYGTPWSGKTRCHINESAPIGAFVRIERSQQNQIQKQPMLEAFGSVFPSCSKMPWDKRIFEQVCDTVSLALNNTDAYKMSCLPNAEAAQICYSSVCKK